MGGSGSGRKPKTDKLEPGEIIGEDNGTIIGEEPPKGARKPPKGKAAGVKVEEARAKINLLFSGLARLAGREYIYQETDFSAEAQGLARLAEKFTVIGYVITLLDPLFMVLSLAQKFLKMPVKKQRAKEDQAGQQSGNVVNMR